MTLPDSPIADATASPPIAPPAAPPRRKLFSDKLALIGSTVLAQGLRIGTTLVMARVVSPDDYGLYSLVLLAPAIFTSIGDLGIPTALISLSDRDEDEVIDTCVVIAALLSTMHFVAFTVGSVFLYLYSDKVPHDWHVIALGVTIGIVNALAMLYNIKLAVLNRRRHFAAESGQNVIFSLSATATGIGFGLLHFGAFALVLQQLVAQLAASIMIWRRVPLRWPRRYTFQTAKRVFAIGGNMSVANYAASLENRAFEFSVLRQGGEGGKVVLANWGRATVVWALFSQNVNTSIDRVVYTTLCANTLPERAKHFREVARRSLETLLLVNCFTAAWLYCLSPEIVRVALGSKWDDVPPVLAILGLAVPAGALNSIGYNVCLAHRRSFPIACWTIVRAMLFIPLLLMPFGWHMTTLAWLFVAGRYFQSSALALSGWRSAGFPPKATAYRLALVLVASLFAGFLMHHLNIRVAALPVLPRFLLVSTGGLSGYIAVCGLLGGDMLTYLGRMSRG